ncbi:hypothetical protein IE53DRAFT_157242 [Violaceomyces palustris]|uniref:Uncharacterized protein n=1 Tax=Violaceomyces palustris TaxID=1673888 RepID=A0ACD0P896_9BASI|nr:hypothetical protein IE53DRAFT_157242 [Violaceomyces palustris]
MAVNWMGSKRNIPRKRFNSKVLGCALETNAFPQPRRDQDDQRAFFIQKTRAALIQRTWPDEGRQSLAQGLQLGPMSGSDGGGDDSRMERSGTAEAGRSEAGQGQAAGNSESLGASFEQKRMRLLQKKAWLGIPNPDRPCSQVRGSSWYQAGREKEAGQELRSHQVPELFVTTDFYAHGLELERSISEDPIENSKPNEMSEREELDLLSRPELAMEADEIALKEKERQKSEEEDDGKGIDYEYLAWISRECEETRKMMLEALTS